MELDTAGIVHEPYTERGGGQRHEGCDDVEQRHDAEYGGVEVYVCMCTLSLLLLFTPPLAATYSTNMSLLTPGGWGGGKRREIAGWRNI